MLATVLFSINFIWIILLIAIVSLYKIMKKYYKWYTLITLQEYNKRFGYNICCYCSSDNIVNLGLYYRRSRYRYYFCTQCGHPLCRFTVILRKIILDTETTGLDPKNGD